MAVRLIMHFDGMFEQASEDELAQAAARADLTGMFTDPHTGVALAALEKLVARREIGPKDRVVVVSTATGLKFPDFKIRYHEGALEGIGADHANRPVLLPADYEAVKSAALSGVDRADGAREAAGPRVTKRSVPSDTIPDAATDAPVVAGRGES